MGSGTRRTRRRWESENAIRALCARTGTIACPTLVVAAHRGDEAIGLGGRLHRIAELTLVHVTDGAPGAPGNQAFSLHVVPGRAAESLAQTCVALAKSIERAAPAVIVTHAYEGGHPDHDATAFAVHAAVRLARAPCTIVEMAGYHGAQGRPVWGRFLARRDSTQRDAPLDAEGIGRRRALLDRHATQPPVLARFPLDLEHFRVAPPYDFRAPPHPGTLLYERLGRGDGASWRVLAARASDALGLSELSWRSA